MAHGRAGGPLITLARDTSYDMGWNVMSQIPLEESLDGSALMNEMLVAVDVAVNSI